MSAEMTRGNSNVNEAVGAGAVDETASHEYQIAHNCPM